MDVAVARRLDVGVLVGERGADHVDGVVGDTPPLGEVEAEQVELAFQVPGADTEDRPPARELVEGHERLRGVEGVPVAHARTRAT